MRTAASRTRLPASVVGALGVVFGDIGTSPLYAFRIAFDPERGIALTSANVFSLLSMIFWSVMIVVSLKYVTIMLRFDNRGEGGVLALLSNCMHALRGRPRTAWVVTMLGAFAVSLFYGDAVITPAISVLAAVEGLAVVDSGLDVFVLPIAIALLVLLFAVQRRGSGAGSGGAGKIMALWFVVIGLAGAHGIVRNPQVLLALDPRFAWNFVVHSPALAFIAAGAVFLCVTGVEALYADMGRFGARPIRVGWFLFVLPALMLNYFGQGALVLLDPQAIRNPFYLLAPQELLLPMVALAVAAALIASQATISGAFSATQQASRLNFLPRLRVLHTSDAEHGRIHIPVVNGLLLALVLALVVGFRSSDALAAAYGIAVAGDLMLTSVMMLVALPFFAGTRVRLLWPLFAVFFALELAFFAANAVKFASGGWVPLLLAAFVFVVLTTWRRGMEILRLRKDMRPKVDRDGYRIDLSEIPRVPGSALFFSSTPQGWPSAFLHNLKHNKVVHEQTLFLTVVFDEVPRVLDDERVEVMRGDDGIVRVIAHFGFRESPRLDGVLRQVARKGVVCTMNDTSFFTSKSSLVSVSPRGPFAWRRSLFGWLLRNSTSVADYFGLPPNRVVELGAQVAI